MRADVLNALKEENKKVQDKRPAASARQFTGVGMISSVPLNQ